MRSIVLRSEKPISRPVANVNSFVASDFANGTGAVQLNGAKWDAESDEPLKAGDAAWVTRHRGIVLTVSGHQPAAAHLSKGE